MNIFEGTNFSFEKAFKEMLSEQVTYPEFEVQNRIITFIVVGLIIKTENIVILY
jgi:hypothetical protein